MSKYQHFVRSAKMSSNRTFMELKSHSLLLPLGPSPTSSNRTFMELKWNNKQAGSRAMVVLIVPLWNWNCSRGRCKCCPLCSSNRTFMELKCLPRQAIPTSAQRVLIVPLWNWNSRPPTASSRRTCSNRTFMELKFVIKYHSYVYNLF